MLRETSIHVSFESCVSQHFVGGGTSVNQGPLFCSSNFAILFGVIYLFVLLLLLLSTTLAQPSPVGSVAAIAQPVEKVKKKTKRKEKERKNGRVRRNGTAPEARGVPFRAVCVARNGVGPSARSIARNENKLRRILLRPSLCYLVPARFHFFIDIRSARIGATGFLRYRKADEWRYWAGFTVFQ